MPTGTTLASAGFPTTFAQNGPGDTAAPVLRSLVISPGSIDTSTGSATITLTARITDEMAGVSDSMHGSSLAQVFNFRSPNGGQSAMVALQNRISGDDHDGIWQGTATIPAYSEQGTWTINTAQLADNAGNYTMPTGTTLAAAGYPTTFEVVRTG